MSIKLHYTTARARIPFPHPLTTSPPFSPQISMQRDKCDTWQKGNIWRGATRQGRSIVKKRGQPPRGLPARGGVLCTCREEQRSAGMRKRKEKRTCIAAGGQSAGRTEHVAPPQGRILWLMQHAFVLPCLICADAHFEARPVIAAACGEIAGR
jgi:hypothetical protein